MQMSVFRGDEIWNVVVSRKHPINLFPIWLQRQGQRILLCQVQNSDRFGWTVVVNGPVTGPRLVEGFKRRWQAIQYAIKIREDLGRNNDEGTGDGDDNS